MKKSGKVPLLGTNRLYLSVFLGTLVLIFVLLGIYRIWVIIGIKDAHTQKIEEKRLEIDTLVEQVKFQSGEVLDLEKEVLRLPDKKQELLNDKAESEKALEELQTKNNEKDSTIEILESQIILRQN